MIEPSSRVRGVTRVSERLDARTKVRLDRNERVTPFPEETFTAMMSAIDASTFTAYPDTARLYTRLAAATGLGEDHIYLTPGSDGAIRMLFQAFVDPGDKVVLAEPTYAMYRIYTGMLGAERVAVRYDAGFRLDVGRVVDALDGARILALANPNQPLGCLVDPADVAQMADAARQRGVLLIVDEAYFGFTTATCAALIASHPNVAVVRSFSKAAGLAGLRVGYILSSPAVIKAVEQVRGAHEVNVVGVRMAEYVLEHPEIVHTHVTEVSEGRAVLLRALGELGLGAPESHANFQLVGFPADADLERVRGALADEGYLVAGPFSDELLAGHLRVTLGPPSIMRGFADALGRVWRGRPR